MFENFFAKIAGKYMSDKLGLQENNKMETKSWYQSKTLWTAIIGGLLGIYGAISTVHPLPPIPQWVLTLLASMGLYGLRTADTKIG